MEEVKVKTQISELNKRTAILYISAAFLIFAVGARMLNTILAESDGLGVFEWIMIASVVLEVLMLAYYAELVRRIPDDGGSSGAGGPVTVQMGHQFSDSFHHVRESMEHLTKELRDTRLASKANMELADRFQKSEEEMTKILEQLVELREEIAEMSRDRLKDNIRTELREMLTSLSLETRSKARATRTTTKKSK